METLIYFIDLFVFSIFTSHNLPHKKHTNCSAKSLKSINMILRISNNFVRNVTLSKLDKDRIKWDGMGWDGIG